MSAGSASAAMATAIKADFFILNSLHAPTTALGNHVRLWRMNPI